MDMIVVKIGGKKAYYTSIVSRFKVFGFIARKLFSFLVYISVVKHGC